MRIAILGWGSLVWDARELSDHIVDGNLGEAAWRLNGPVLPIEFSRVSGQDERRYLSLVIDPKDGTRVVTRTAQSKRSNIEESIADLRCRESTTLQNIGFVDLKKHLWRCRHPSIVEALNEWTKGTDFDSVVWTDLPPNFGEVDKKGQPFSVDLAVAFLHSLAGASLDRAREYIRRAPKEVDTPVRRRALESGWLDGGLLPQ